MTKKKDNRGGARVGAGAKPKQNEKVKSYGVYLTPTEKERLTAMYGSLTAAIKTLIIH